MNIILRNNAAVAYIRKIAMQPKIIAFVLRIKAFMRKANEWVTEWLMFNKSILLIDPIVINRK